MYSFCHFFLLFFHHSSDALQFHDRILHDPDRLDQDPDLGLTLVEKVFLDWRTFKIRF